MISQRNLKVKFKNSLSEAPFPRGRALAREEKKAPGHPARLNFSKFYKLGDGRGDLSRISAGKLWEFLSLLTSVQADI
jgi:hypothetical protein